MGFSKALFIINGVERMVHIDDRETLAEFLRRYGLTSVKVGCDAGQCGACTVLLNGDPVRSCVKKMGKIPEFSTIETLEGLGTASNLHPLQMAWIVYGGVQCGFCTPGFIMSAKALLDRNLSPTRQEIREWFTKHKNICRCTGYKALVDAVMAASEVMRGDKPLSALRYKGEENQVYGTAYPRPQALGRVLGITDYGDDMALKMPDGTVHLAIVLAEVSHGRLLNLDSTAAEQAPGVIKVVTANDIKGSNNILPGISHPRNQAAVSNRPILVRDIIRRKGDVLCVVAADSRQNARDAARLVKAEIEALPAAMSLLEAVLPDAPPIQEGSPNTFIKTPLFKGEEENIDAIFENAAHAVDGSFYSCREPHLVLEPHSLQAYVDKDGVLVVCWKSQFLHQPMFTLPAALGIDQDKVRFIDNPGGGTFGLAMSADAPGLVGAATLALGGRPVSLTMSYREHQIFTGKRAPSYCNARVCCDENGKLLAWEYDIATDHGAYAETAGLLQDKMNCFSGYGLNIPNARGLSRAVFTNNTYGISYRSFGSPQVYTSSEQLIDMLAEKAGIDPFEFRQVNAAKPGDTTLNSRPYHFYAVGEMLDRMRPYWDESKRWAAENPGNGKLRGVGCALGGFHVGNHSDTCEVWLELNPDGSVTDYNCWQEVGEGTDIGSIALAHEALKPLGLRADQIKLIQNDTGICPKHGATAGSRSHYVSGNAHIVAANLLMDAMRKSDGSYRTYDEMVAEGIPTLYKGVWSNVGQHEPNDPNNGEGDAMLDHNHIIQIAKVEVDPKTGAVDVVAVHSLADVGVIGNRLTMDGQAIGGLEHAIGMALYEEYSDDDKKYETMIGCGTLQCNQMPDEVPFEYLETPREGGPFGSGGASECFQSSAHVCVLNAIADAIGVRIYEPPANPEMIRRALEAKAQGKDLKPEKYYMGESLEDAIAYIKDNPVVAGNKGPSMGH